MRGNGSLELSLLHQFLIPFSSFISQHLSRFGILEYLLLAVIFARNKRLAYHTANMSEIQVVAIITPAKGKESQVRDALSNLAVKVKENEADVVSPPNKPTCQYLL